MVFQWWRRRQRQRRQAEPFPRHWFDILHRNVALYSQLRSPEQRRVQQYVQVFSREKNWEGCGGLTITDEIRVTISALTGILVLGFEDQYFDQVLSVLVYPGAFGGNDAVTAIGDSTLYGFSARDGEAWYRGPVVLSWSDVLEESRDTHGTSNVVLHEFAHQLDMLNGRVSDGVPVMASRDQYERWQAVVNRQYEQLTRDCAGGRPTVIDGYGANSLSEFFAVITETFFQQPQSLRSRHGELYELLRDFYAQDPAQRVG